MGQLKGRIKNEYSNVQRAGRNLNHVSSRSAASLAYSILYKHASMPNLSSLRACSKSDTKDASAPAPELNKHEVNSTIPKNSLEL